MEHNHYLFTGTGNSNENENSIETLLRTFGAEENQDRENELYKLLFRRVDNSFRILAGVSSSASAGFGPRQGTS